MEINGVDRCPGCMHEKAGQAICPRCGWDEPATVWSGPVHLKRWRERWEIDTMRHLEKER